jgi:hypothetical protein
LINRNRLLSRITPVGVALLLFGTPDFLACIAQAQTIEQSSAPVQGGTSNSEPASNPQELPDSPGSLRAQATLPSPAPPAPQAQSVTDTQKPVGTAAAEVGTASGVAASKPAGVAIAPAKQRRVRSILIKLGAVAGAGVAVGTVLALSQASPSRPPGAK